MGIAAVLMNAARSGWERGVVHHRRPGPPSPFRSGRSHSPRSLPLNQVRLPPMPMSENPVPCRPGSPARARIATPATSPAKSFIGGLTVGARTRTAAARRLPSREAKRPRRRATSLPARAAAPAFPAPSGISDTARGDGGGGKGAAARARGDAPAHAGLRVPGGCQVPGRFRPHGNEHRGPMLLQEAHGLADPPEINCPFLFFHRLERFKSFPCPRHAVRCPLSWETRSWQAPPTMSLYAKRSMPSMIWPPSRTAASATSFYGPPTSSAKSTRDNPSIVGQRLKNIIARRPPHQAAGRHGAPGIRAGLPRLRVYDHPRPV